MISWGTRYDNIGNYLHTTEEECKICSKSSKHNYIGEQAQFTFFGMPLAPTGKTYYKICPQCRTRLKVKHGDKTKPYVEDALQGKPKLKYFWGWFIVLPIVVSLVLFFMNINSK